MNIILIGFRGTGKTTIGKALVKKTGFKYISIDDEIKKSEKCDISEIIKKSGWPYFRKIESEMIRKISSLDGYIIDTGGGSILSSKNRKNLRRNSFIILFTSSLNVIYKRISGNTDRPKLTDKKNMKEEIAFLLKKRKEKYYSIADYVINSSKKSKSIIINMIVKKLRKESII